MFDSLSDKLGDALGRLRGRGRITEQNVRDTMRQVRQALLEADVSVKIAREFCDRVQEKAIGQEVLKSLHPGQVMVKAVHDELVDLMGPVDTSIYFVSPPPTIILLAGLQGSGKTTTCGKLAKYLKSRGKNPCMVAGDLQRPAAIDQLQVLGQQLDVPVFANTDRNDPVRVCREGISWAKGKGNDVIILDTAGRLAIDHEMMDQIERVSTVVRPHQIYLVVDSMTGQDAVRSAEAFNSRLELDGVILTKFDSDTRGGAALSVKAVTGKPIKFIGVGEKLDRIEEFHPERMAGRILGMGDVVSLVEKAQESQNQEEALLAQEKMKKGVFGFDDFLQQLDSVKRMGPLREVMKMIPGVSKNMSQMDFDEDDLQQIRGIIHSMTPHERQNPDDITTPRRRRIARGSGVQPEDVSGLVKQFTQIRGVVKAMSGMGMTERMRLAGQFSNAAMSGSKFNVKVKQRSKRKQLDRKEKKKRRKASRKR
jgi:signal recognition particle subunit SRP54